MTEKTPTAPKPKMHYRIIGRRWPFKKTRYMWLLMFIELIVLIPNLVLHGLAHPDTWRTTMWEIGYENGWNSDPRMIIYAAANYRPEPTIPFVWSKLLTVFTVAITIVTLFTLLLRIVLFIMKVFYPIISLFCFTGLVTVWTISIYGQMGPDHADPDRPSSIAWYITRSCDAAGGRFRAEKECKMAKAAFAISVLMLVLMLVHLGIAIWGMLPNAQDRKPRGRKRDRDASDSEDSDAGSEDEDDLEDRSSGASSPADHKARRGQSGTWELRSMSGANPKAPLSPRVAVQPYTPRTMAFHTLDRKLPLRQ